MGYREEFEEQGYFVVPGVLGPEQRADLLREIIEAYGTSKPTVIKNPKFRRHTPLPLSDSVSDAVTAVLEHGYEVLESFLKNDKDLVELSSISVFPNAEAQPLHRDEANPGHYLASVFVNLMATRAEAGALQVVPGSHRMDEGGDMAPQALELPAGSAVFMNSKLLHCGGANTSGDAVRTVFYFSVGEAGLYGPPYSMLDSVTAQGLTMQHFRPRPGQSRVGWTLESRPQLVSSCRILMPLSEESTELLLADDDSIVRSLNIDEANEYLVDILQCIEAHPRELEVQDLADKFALNANDLLNALKGLARDGWLRR